MNPLASAVLIPIFALLIGGEYLLARLRGMKVYSWPDTATNISCALGQMILDFPLLVGIALVYAWTSTHLAPFHWSTGVASTVILFVVTDFVSYWFHRASHTYPWLWRVHAVHHQSEEFNFSVGIRIPWFHKIVALPIYLVPALLGFEFHQYLLVAVVHASWQTFTHTRVYDADWPWLRAVFVTPVHHRLHHSRASEHFGRNLSNVFSVWDYLFGSAVRDLKEPEYGIGQGVASYNPVMVQLKPLHLNPATDVPSPSVRWLSMTLTFSAIGLYMCAWYLREKMPDLISLLVSATLILIVASGILLEKGRHLGARGKPR